MHARMNECEYVCVLVHINICVCMRVYVCVCTHVRMYVRIYLRVCMYCTYVKNSIASSWTPFLESGGGGRLSPFPDPLLPQLNVIIGI